MSVTIDIGTPVRTLVEVLAGSDILPIDSRGTVIGYEGDRLVVEFRDEEADMVNAVTVEVWEVRK